MNTEFEARISLEPKGIEITTKIMKIIAKFQDGKITEDEMIAKCNALADPKKDGQ